MGNNAELRSRWEMLESKLVKRFGKKPDLESVLFLIGIQEYGGPKVTFTKEEKQDLMHIAVCALFMQSGYYEIDSYDADRWPHFRQLKPLPEMGLDDQEDFLKDHILLYFSNNDF